MEVPTGERKKVKERQHMSVTQMCDYTESVEEDFSDVYTSMYKSFEVFE